MNRTVKCLKVLLNSGNILNVYSFFFLNNFFEIFLTFRFLRSLSKESLKNYKVFQTLSFSAVYIGSLFKIEHTVLPTSTVIPWSSYQRLKKNGT